MPPRRKNLEITDDVVHETLEEAFQLAHMGEYPASKAKYDFLLSRLQNPFLDPATLSQIATIRGQYGNLFLKMGEIAEAIGQFELIRQFFKTYRESFQTDKGFPQAEDELPTLLSLAQAFISNGSHSQALKTLLEGLTMAKQVKDPLVKAEGRCVHMIGMSYKAQGKLDQAEAKLKQCLEAYGSDSSAEWLHQESESAISPVLARRLSFVDAHMDLGDILYRQGESDMRKLLESEAMYTKALDAALLFFKEDDTAGKIRDAHWRVATVLLHRRQWEVALRMLRAWLKLEVAFTGKEGANFEEIHYRIGKCLNRMWRHKDAFVTLDREATLLRAPRKEPSILDAPTPVFEPSRTRMAQCIEEIGIAFLAKEENVTAVRHFNQAMELLEPTDLRTLARITTANAQALAHIGLSPEALRQFSKAIDLLTPFSDITSRLDLSDPLDWRGRYYYLSKDYGKALEDLERAFQIREELLGPGHWDTILTRSQIQKVYSAMGREEEAEALGREDAKWKALRQERLQHEPESLECKVKTAPESSQSSLKTSQSLMEDAGKLLARGETRFAQRRFSDARIDFSRCINRLRACDNDASDEAGKTENRRQQLARALLKRVEACIARGGATMDQHIAARKDLEEVGSILKGGNLRRLVDGEYDEVERPSGRNGR